MTTERVSVEDKVLRFALATGDCDGLDDDGWQQLARLSRTIGSSGATCVLLHGTGGVFCTGDQGAGATQGAVGSDGAEGHWGRVALLHAPAIRAVCESPVPVVAAIGGLARDAGVVLALAADVRLIAESARLSLRGVTGASALPAGLGWLLSRRAPSLVGRLVYGAEVDADAAAVIAAAVVKDHLLHDRAMQLARQLAGWPEAARARRAALGPVAGEGLEVALGFDAELAALCSGVAQPSGRSDSTGGPPPAPRKGGGDVA
jgi:2-(1,2-epoxy-1,2-dihydrophenyl)acetyl-CoA isomerase